MLLERRGFDLLLVDQATLPSDTTLRGGEPRAEPGSSGPSHTALLRPTCARLLGWYGQDEFGWRVTLEAAWVKRSCVGASHWSWSFSGSPVIVRRLRLPTRACIHASRAGSRSIRLATLPPSVPPMPISSRARIRGTRAPRSTSHWVVQVPTSTGTISVAISPTTDFSISTTRRDTIRLRFHRAMSVEGSRGYSPSSTSPTLPSQPTSSTRTLQRSGPITPVMQDAIGCSPGSPQI